MSLTSARLTFRNIAYHVRIGASALLGEVAIAAVIVVGNYVFMQYLGPDGVAAYSVGCYCLPVVFMMGNAIVQSVQPIASFAYGQGDKIRFASSARVAYVTAGASGIMSMIIMMLGTGAISSMFLDDQCGAYTLCVDGLPYFSLSFLFISFNIVAVGLMQSAERAVAATIYTLMRGFILSIPCFIFMPMWFDSVGLWLALPIAEAITTLIIVLRRDLSCDISHVNIS
jgi:Na+-driven multidrug efflux pump